MIPNGMNYTLTWMTSRPFECGFATLSPLEWRPVRFPEEQHTCWLVGGWTLVVSFIDDCEVQRHMHGRMIHRPFALMCIIITYSYIQLCNPIHSNTVGVSLVVLDFIQFISSICTSSNTSTRLDKIRYFIGYHELLLCYGTYKYPLYHMDVQ